MSPQFETPVMVSVAAGCKYVRIINCESGVSSLVRLLSFLPTPPLDKQSGLDVEEESASESERSKSELAPSGQSPIAWYFVSGPLIWSQQRLPSPSFLTLYSPPCPSRPRSKLWVFPFRSFPPTSPPPLPRFPLNPPRRVHAFFSPACNASSPDPLKIFNPPLLPRPCISD